MTEKYSREVTLEETLESGLEELYESWETASPHFLLEAQEYVCLLKRLPQLSKADRKVIKTYTKKLYDFIENLPLENTIVKQVKKDFELALSENTKTTHTILLPGRGILHGNINYPPE